MDELVAVDYRAADSDVQFVLSLRKTGFGVLKNHPIKEATVQAIYDNWYGFFGSEDKHSYLFDTEKFDGFFPTTMAETAKGHSIPDFKEYYHYYPWGRCPEGLKEQLDHYYADAVSLASTLLSWVERLTPANVASDYSEPLSTMIQGSDQSLLRILHYPPMPKDIDSGAIRASAHEDINLLTLLPASNEPGLQVKKRDGSWLDVPCDFGNLIINVGDMLQEASGGYFPCLLYTSPSPRDKRQSRMPSSA